MIYNLEKIINRKQFRNERKTSEINATCLSHMFNKENISKMKREVADNDKHSICAGAGAQWHSTCWAALGLILRLKKKSDNLPPPI